MEEEIIQKTPYLKGLNPSQLKAVLCTEGPLLIMAGAGAGKTKTVTLRILHLIKQGVNPENILAITFTNKAAKEMRERVGKLLKEEEKGYSKDTVLPFLSTFHSLGVYIIRQECASLGLPRFFSIFDKDDAKKAVKDAIEKLGMDPKHVNPGSVLSAISKEKGMGNSLDQFLAAEGKNYFEDKVAEVWPLYEKTLTAENALDFDDLLLKTMILLKNPEIRKKYQNKWKYIHIDEYQDTNKVQYEIVKYLAGETKNLAVVGDVDQCLLPETKIKTQNGQKEISKLKKGEIVISGSGGGKICEAIIEKIKKRKYKGEIIKIQTKKGNTLKLTHNHIVFAGLTLTQNIYYVYLMYKRNIGFRIGIVQGVRNQKHNKNEIGPLVRCNQEKADKMWILKICKNKQEAQYFEYYFSSFYGIPMIVFHIVGRKMSWNQENINRLFKDIPTEERAIKIFDDLKMSFDYPHYFPQGTTNSNSTKNRLNIRLTMFSDKRKSLIHPWGLSRISINSNNTEAKEIVEKLGFSTRKGKHKDWRVEITKLDYGESEKIAKELTEKIPGSTLIKTALLTKNNRLLFQPASNLHPTMKIAIFNGKKIVEDEIVKVSKENYIGDVYDLDINSTHNYIAENIAVHNCIYSWRGADFKNIMRFEKDYPETESVLLEENYRSTKNILAVANAIIQKNTMRKDKNLFTKNEDGELISLYAGLDERDEASYIASRAKELIENGHKPDEIAVLYRANFQSRSIEEAFIKMGVSYNLIGTKFFERKEIKDALSYIRASLNPQSISDIKRIINTPARGIGKVTVLKILEGKEEELTGATMEKIRSFRNLLSDIKEKTETEKPSEVVKFVIARTGMEEMFKKGKEEDLERLENLRELVTFATSFDYDDEEAMMKFLEHASLFSDQDEMTEEKVGVKLMTVHAAKGLEFDTVFITGLEDKLFPHQRIGEEESSLEQEEEERRLFYVALTRARRKIFLTYASIRTVYGSREIRMPSEFIMDIDDEMIKKENSFLHDTPKTSWFSQF